jgi:hypothetical protein
MTFIVELSFMTVDEKFHFRMHFLIGLELCTR